MAGLTWHQRYALSALLYGWLSGGLFAAWLMWWLPRRRRNTRTSRLRSDITEALDHEVGSTST